MGGFFFVFGALQRGNTIGGNDGDGVQIVNGSNNTTVTRNNIGTNISGTLPVSNGLSGVAIFGGALSNRLGDGTSANLNLIAGNASYGVYIAGATTSSNTIALDDIGVNSKLLVAADRASREAGQPAAAAMIGLPNGSDGVTMQNGTFGNVITASTWIANNASGVWMAGGAHDNVVHRTSLFTNRFYGVLMEGAPRRTTRSP